MKRKVIQVAVASSTDADVVVALCDDGTLWRINPFNENDSWRPVYHIPQPDEERSS